jgi:D-glycero-alpha-D-manno-heptose 1-phosphate guanylyltransferase
MQQGINHFVLSVGYRHEDIIKHFGEQYKGAKIDYVIETKPLGTGGGFLLATDKVDKNQPFLLLNGDTFFAVDLKSLDEFALAKDADWCFSLFRTHDKARYMGMNVSPQGQIVGLISDLCASEHLANGGVYWVNPRALCDGKFSPGDRLSLEDDFFKLALESEQHLMGIEVSNTFIDIGVPDDYHLAATILKL